MLILKNKLVKTASISEIYEMASQFGGATALSNGKTFSYTNIVDDEIEQMSALMSDVNKIKLYVPSNINGVKDLKEQQRQVKFLIDNGMEEYRPDTEKTGYWYDSESDTIVSEPIVMMSITNPTDFQKQLVLEFAMKIKREMKQQGVSIEINNDFIIIV